MKPRMKKTDAAILAVMFALAVFGAWNVPRFVIALAGWDWLKH